VRIRTRLTWEHNFLAPPKSSTAPKGFMLYSSEAPLLVGIPLAPGGVVIEVRGRTIRSQALNGQSIEVFLLLSLSLSLALFFSLVLPKYSLPMCFVARVLHRASTSFEVWLDLEVLP